MLKNCHLVTSWLPTLEKELHAIKLSTAPGSSAGTGSAAGGAAVGGGNSAGVNSGFRLFLTSEAHEKFPPTLLEACVKVRSGGELRRLCLHLPLSSPPPNIIQLTANTNTNNNTPLPPGHL